jgi:hypothetical protein
MLGYELISPQDPMLIAADTIQLQQRDAVGEVIQHQDAQGHVSPFFPMSR